METHYTWNVHYWVFAVITKLRLKKLDNGLYSKLTLKYIPLPSLDLDLTSVW